MSNEQRIEQEILGTVRGLLESRVNELLRKFEFTISYHQVRGLMGTSMPWPRRLAFSVVNEGKKNELSGWTLILCQSLLPCGKAICIVTITLPLSVRQ
jgi:hypothetical protein